MTSELEAKPEGLAAPPAAASTAPAAAAAPSYDEEDEDAPFQRAVAGTSLAPSTTAAATTRTWKAGDSCLAVWSEDNA